VSLRVLRNNKCRQSIIKLGEVVQTSVHVYRSKLVVEHHLLLLFLLVAFLLLDLFFFLEKLSGNCVLAFVLAGFALAILGAAYACVIAFAVALEAVRLLAVASFLCLWAVAIYAFFYTELRFENGLFEARGIVTIGTGTIVATLLALWETFAVHFEAESFLASAAYFTFFGGLGCSVYVRNAIGEGIFLFLVQMGWM